MSHAVFICSWILDDTLQIFTEYLLNSFLFTWTLAKVTQAMVKIHYFLKGEEVKVLSIVCL